MLLKDTVTKATIEKRVYFGPTVSKDESIPPWQETRQQTGRHGARTVTESLHLIHRQEVKRGREKRERVRAWNGVSI